MSAVMPCSGECFECGLFELGHLCRSADGNPAVGGPSRPSPSDVNLFCLHGFDVGLSGALGVQHETVADGQDEIDVVLVEEGEDIFTNGTHRLAAFRNQALHLQACYRAGHSSARKGSSAV